MGYIRFCEDGYEISPPEGIRISDGPRMSIREVPWPPGVHFYKVTDLEKDTHSYCTSVEVSLKCGLPLRVFRRMYKKKKRMYGVGSIIFNHTMHIQRIPKMLFIRETGREFDEVREYFWRY